VTTRRSILKYLAATTAAAQSSLLGAQIRPEASIRRDVPYRRIATEEAFSTPEIMDLYRRELARNPADEPGFVAMWGGFMNRDQDFFDQLLSLGERRLSDMDTTGIAMQVLSLTAPGVQVFDAETATSLARDTNDRLAEACRQYPARFAGLTAVAPQDPRRAAQEIERGMGPLGLHGIIISSWEIFEAAEANDAAIYIHPRTPAPAMLGPWLDRGFHGPLGGFAVEVYLHTLSIISSGAFDRFPALKIVIGHMGEGLPYFMYRLDYMQGQARGLQRRISDYLKDNVYVTTSGMAWEPAIKFAQDVLGTGHVLYAMDYPYEFEPHEVQITDELSISDEAKLKLYQTNAERIFHL
jgi:5-carboxyvanillate decarboxylase